MRNILKNIKNYIWSKKRFKIFVKNAFDKKYMDNINYIFDSVYLEKHIQPLEQTTPSNKRIVVIAPHPDDEILGCGGLLLKAQENKCKISIIFLSSGGVDEIEIREREALKVASELNITDIKFLRLEDSNVLSKIEYEKICTELQSFRPDIILLPFIFDKHNDHINSNRILLEMPEEFDTEVWCYQVYSTMPCNGYLDITAIAERKYKIMSLYKSQIDHFDYVNWNRGLNAFNSKYAHDTKKKYIESYFILPFTDYKNICTSYFNEQ